nr:uncharacterized mitochondrial protein AtMg00810-like [Tanacetum cinerariifolium]
MARLAFCRLKLIYYGVTDTLHVSNTNKPVSVAASVSAVSAKIPVSALLNVDSLSNDVIYSFFASQSNSPQLDNDDLKQIDADDLKEMNLKWQMSMECMSPKDTRRNDVAAPQRRNVPVETSTSNLLVSQCDGVGSYDWSFQADEEPTNYALMAFTSLSSSFDNELRDNALVVLRQNLEKAKQERDDLKLKLEKFQTSSKNLSELLASQTNDKTGNGYHAIPPPYTGTFMPPKPDLVFHNAPNDVEIVHTAFNVKLSPTKPDHDLSHTHRPSTPIIEDWVSDSEDESKTKIPHNVLSFVQPTEQVKSPRPSIKHVNTSIPTATPKTTIPNPTRNGTCRNRKASFVCKSLTHVIKDCDYHEKTMAQTPTKNHAPRGNPQHALKDKGVIDSGCLRHMIGNMSYMSDFEELNGGYVAFGGNPKGGKISRKGKIRTGKLDFDDVYFIKELKFNLFSVSQMCDKKNSVLFTDTECLVLSPEFKLPAKNLVLLRVPRENYMYNVDLKNIVPSGDSTCLFAKATLDESNLCHSVYVCQPPRFEDPDYPDKVYKVVKALYGLHQAHRAWYETLANYLLENGFQRGKIDQTLFIKRQKAFEKLMKDKFQMSSMGELTFFLGLQVKQKKDGIFISLDKYVVEILRKFGLTEGKSASTPIDTKKPLLKDPDGEDVDVHTYRSMIGSLMYLTSSRPEIMFAVCACARFQVTPKASHLHAVKRIFRYLMGKPHLGLWYPKDSPFNLVAYSDSDYAGASLDRKSTTGGCQFLGYRLIFWQCKKQTIVATSSIEVEYVAAASCCV